MKPTLFVNNTSIIISNPEINHFQNALHMFPLLCTHDFRPANLH